MDTLWATIERDISQHSGQQQRLRHRRSASGGCINQSFAVATDHGRWFVKLNAASMLPMFEAEAEALTAINNTHSIRVPTPLTTGSEGQHAYLIMQHLDMDHPVSPRAFGEAMAKLHTPAMDQPFGWHRDNTIGTTPQQNTPHPRWSHFFAHQRLGFQIKRAARHGASRHLLDSVETLIANIDSFFPGYQPQAALLHGDLWSGNWGALADGIPVIFDPASYYGDHEADLAMMELFGHPGPAFFDRYREHHPIDSGYDTRKVLYNLYHILNHFNLFGGAYASQAQSMTDRLLAEIK